MQHLKKKKTEAKETKKKKKSTATGSRINFSGNLQATAQNEGQCCSFTWKGYYVKAQGEDRVLGKFTSG